MIATIEALIIELVVIKCQIQYHISRNIRVWHELWKVLVKDIMSFHIDINLNQGLYGQFSNEIQIGETSGSKIDLCGCICGLANTLHCIGL